MLVRVDVRRILAGQSAKSRQLASGLVRDCVSLVQRDDLMQRDPCPVPLAPFAEIEAEAEAEGRVRSSTRRRLGGVSPRTMRLALVTIPH